MILESIVSTINPDGSANVSPMGPQMTSGFTTFELRPFNTSRTFANLKRSRAGVMHVTDNVELFALAAIGKLDRLPKLMPAHKVTGQVIANACRAFEFQVEYIDETGPRMNLNCRTVHQHRMRDFWGFNRAKHAVIECAIVATRVEFLPAEEIQDAFIRSETIIAKTGGQSEHAAFERLSQFVGYTIRNQPQTNA